MGNNPDVIVGLDIGTTKVAAIVAQRAGGGKVDIIGIGTSPRRGFARVSLLILRRLLSRYAAL